MPLKILLKILGILIYSAVFGELFVRLFSPVAIVPRYVSETEYGIRGNQPNKSYWHIGPEYKVEVRTNTQGIRSDREFAYVKPTGVYRIVLLGDSFGMGYEVSLKDSFASQLENEFLKQTGQPCEIINLSTSGHGTAEELIVLQERGVKYQPDLVLLSWHRTDYKDNIRSNLYALNNGELTRRAKTYLPGVEARETLSKVPLYSTLANSSQLFNFARERAANAVKEMLLIGKRNINRVDAPENEMKGEKSEKSKYATQYENELAISLIREIERVSHKIHAKFLILDIPQRLSRTEFISTLPPHLRSNDSKISYYSPISDFIEYHGEKLYWEKGHGHFTPLGCKVVGRGLAKKIIEIENN